MLHCGPAHARRALRQTGELQCHDQARDRNRQRIAHAGAVREHDVALQRREVGGVDAHRRQLTETGIHAVNRRAGGHHAVDGPSPGLDLGTAHRVERRACAEVDGTPGGKRDGARLQGLGRVLHTRILRYA